MAEQVFQRLGSGRSREFLGTFGLLVVFGASLYGRWLLLAAVVAVLAVTWAISPGVFWDLASGFTRVVVGWRIEL